MTSTTDPTVPLPTATDTDDDDDDDDVSSTLVSGQPPAATSLPAQPTITPAPTPPPAPAQATPAPSAPAFGSVSGSRTSGPQSSATGLADSLPSGSTTPQSSLDPSNNNNNNGNDSLSAGEAAGVGIGVALVVCLAAFGIWVFLRRRKKRHTTRSTSNHRSDEEHAPQAQKSEIYAYHADGPAEISGDEKPRRWSELESPTYVAEIDNGQVFRAELPGSTMPVVAEFKGGDERLFSDAPIDEVDEIEETKDVKVRAVGEKTDERLFSDSPIDEEGDTLETDPTSRPAEKKG